MQKKNVDIIFTFFGVFLILLVFFFFKKIIISLILVCNDVLQMHALVIRYVRVESEQSGERQKV